MRAIALNPLLFVLVYTIIIIVSVAIIMRTLAGRVGQVTSWYRTPWKNNEVGGLAGSAHLIGWACDIIPVTDEREQAARAIFPVVVNEGDHLHVSVFRA